MRRSMTIKKKKQTMIAQDLVDIYEDWWNGRNRKPLLAVYVGDPKFKLGDHMPPWMDRSVPGYKLFSYALSFCEKEKSFRPLHDVFDLHETSSKLSGLEYLGAAFPTMRTDFGAVPVAGVISGFAEFDMASKSMWFELAEGWSLERIAALPEDASSPWADLCRGAGREAVQRFGGRILMVEPAMFGRLDVLAALRSTGQLLMDCMDSPELVHAALAALEPIFWRYWDETRALLAPCNQGLYSSWIGVLSNRPYATSQADFSVMLSPALFEEFALPGIRREAERIGRTAYHLDGPEQIKYLDMILAIPEVRAIQWPPYPGLSVLKGDCDEMIRKVIDSGRRLVMSEIPPDPGAVRTLFSRFPGEAFHLSMWAPDVETGKKVVKESGA